MEVATTASTFALHTRMSAPPTRSLISLSLRTQSHSASISSISTNFVSSFAGGNLSSDFSGYKFRPSSLNTDAFSTSKPKRGVVTMYEDADKPIYLYINSTGTTKGGKKLGYETEAFAMYDVMRYVKPPIFTLCVGNAWGEAALLLAAGAKGNRSALPSSTIMIKQPIARFQGQATDVDLARKEIKNVKTELVNYHSDSVPV